MWFRCRTVVGPGLVCTLLACGRSGVWFPPPDVRECETEPGRSQGCDFIVSPSLDLAAPLAANEPNGVVVANPDPDAIVAVAAYMVTDDGEEQLVGEPHYLQPLEDVLITLPVPIPTGSTVITTGGHLRLVGDAPFVASQHAPARSFVGNDSALLLPRSALGRTHVVATYPPHFQHFQGVGEPSWFVVVATEDDTEVRFRPRMVNTAGDGSVLEPVAAGEWSSPIVLQRHDALRVVPNVRSWDGHDARDLSGTVVEASHAVHVTSGTRCASVPTSFDPRRNCDPMFEQALPVSAWGRRYVVPHPPLRADEHHFVRIFAGADVVELTTDPPVLPSSPYLLSDGIGSFVEVEVPHGTSFVVDADEPILAVAYLQSRELADPVGGPAGLGDPAMYQLVSTDRYLDHYTVATGVDWDTHLLQVVAPRDVAVRIDESAVDAWEAVGRWQTAVVEVGPGVHVLEAAQPFGVTQLGWNNGPRAACRDFSAAGTCQTSYAHPGGVGPGR